VGLLRKLVSRQMVPLAMGGRGGLVGVGGEVMVFSGAIVRALRHIGSPEVWMRHLAWKNARPCSTVQTNVYDFFGVSILACSTAMVTFSSLISSRSRLKKLI